MKYGVNGAECTFASGGDGAERRDVISKAKFWASARRLCQASSFFNRPALSELEDSMARALRRAFSESECSQLFTVSLTSTREVGLGPCNGTLFLDRFL